MLWVSVPSDLNATASLMTPDAAGVQLQIRYKILRRNASRTPRSLKTPLSGAAPNDSRSLDTLDELDELDAAFDITLT